MYNPIEQSKDNDILLDVILHKATLKLAGSLMSLAPRVSPMILTTGCWMLLTKNFLYVAESMYIRIPRFFQAFLN